MTQFNKAIKPNQTIIDNIVSVIETKFPLSITNTITSIRTTVYSDIVKNYSTTLTLSDNTFNYKTDILISPKVNKLITKLCTNVSFEVMSQKTQLLIQYKLISKGIIGTSKHRIVAMVSGAGLFCNYPKCNELFHFLYSVGLSDNKVYSPLYYINKSEYFRVLDPDYRLVGILVNQTLNTNKVYYSGNEVSEVIYHKTVNDSFIVKSGLLIFTYKTFDFVTTLKYDFLHKKGNPPIELILSNLYIGEKRMVEDFL